MTAPHVLVVGGGLIGLGTAYALRRSRPDVEVTVIEKEPEVGRHQSGHNSGVLHAGLYYKPGSLKARLAVTGIRQMKEFCAEHHVPFDVCGKLVVATEDGEIARLHTLHERGVANGLQGLALIGAAEAREREPHVRCVAAVRVPEEGIVDYPEVSRVLSAEITARGGAVRTSCALLGLRQQQRGWHAETTAGVIRADYLVNCAGLQVDRVAEMAGHHSDVRIVPFRGEYHHLRAERQFLVRHLIYPVPDPDFPFLGVHFTRMISGGVEAGPNAVLALAREGYRWRDVNAADTAHALAYPGLWRFMSKHARMVGFELLRSASAGVFCRSLQRLVPELQPSDLVSGGAGVRAQAMLRDGTLVQDFRIDARDRALHLLNAPSPGATASLAIGDYVVAQMDI